MWGLLGLCRLLVGWLWTNHSFLHSSNTLWTIYQMLRARLAARATEMNNLVSLFLGELNVQCIDSDARTKELRKICGHFAKIVSVYGGSPRGGAALSVKLQKDFVAGMIWGLPWRPVVKTSSSSAGGAGLIPAQGVKIPCLVAEKPKHKTETIL